MLKKKLASFSRKLSKPSQYSVYNTYSYSYNNKQNTSQNTNSNYKYTFSALALGAGLIGYQQLKRKNAYAEESEQNKQQEEPFYQKSIKENLGVAYLIQEREKQKQEEYKKREEIDLNSLDKDVTKEDLKQMRDLDKLYGDWKKEGLRNELNNGEEGDDLPQDPYARSQEIALRHQEYRIIKIGSFDLLQNGQMIQVSVCDPFDETKYHPTDKVLIAKHLDKYYALGCFCGFDYTNLATGAFLGEKIICPTCGSTYNVKNGFVDQGPSLRNLSAFHVQTRENQIKVVLPEHVPAFARKQFIEKASIDPRVFVVLGDSETALAAIDALRTSFTGKIVVVPCSPYGSFENQDILNRKFYPINKNESFFVEEDYLDRANIDVVKGEIKRIDLGKKLIYISGVKKPIEFDKVMVAWGSNKKRFEREYSNVYYLEDRHSHARVHNEILKAKVICIMGGTFEAYQTAASIREYLDSIGYHDKQIILFNADKSELQSTFGKNVSDQVHQLMKQQRISVLMNCELTKIQGLQKIEGVYFKKPDQPQKEQHIEYFIKPDIVIAENGLGEPKYELSKILAPGENSEAGEPPLTIGIDPQGVPASDVKFSLHYNDLHSPIFAAGSCTQFPSFLHKIKIRTQDIKYNIEAGFFAAMNMLDKRVEFRYMPMAALKIGDTPLYFLGERNSPFQEVIINGSVEDKKFVAYFVYGNEITGILTCGFQNLHLYLWEAMKLLIMPPASQLRSHQMDYKHIVQKVLQVRPYINCKRHEIVKVPSIILAEFDQELESHQDLVRRLKANIDGENVKQKEKFKKMKEKYDREGVEFIQDELDIAEKTGEGEQDENKKATTLRGSRKPGKTSTEESQYSKVNMGGDDFSQKNPFSQLINLAKKGFNGGG